MKMDLLKMLIINTINKVTASSRLNISNKAQNFNPWKV